MAKYKAYPEYKDSGVEWLGMVPSHWNIKRLGQFFEERRDKVSDKDYPPLSVTMQGIVPQIDTAAKTDAGDNRKLVLKNDFVINSRSDRKGSSGVSQLNGSVSLISIVMEPKRINPKFAHHLLRSYPFQEEFYRYGKGIVADLWSTNSSEMKNILIPELADDESNAIACFLDHETAKIDKLFEKQQQLIELLKEKRQAVISHAVTKGLNPDVPMKDSGVEWLGEVPEHWEVKKLKHVAHIIDCKNRTPEYFDDGEYLVVRTTNVKKQSLVLDDALYTNERDFKIWTERGVPPVGSILFTREAPAGEICIVPAFTKLCMGQRMMNFICHQSNYTNFLFDYLTSDCLKRYIESEAAGSTVSHLRVEQVYNIPIVIPPNSEQKNIDEMVGVMKAQYSRLIDDAECSLVLLQERRNALISAAVTGKIDVRDWVAPDTKDIEEPEETTA